ncbi:MAG: phosphatidate cytidylyltransferase [Verrucomicrobiota bacterium]
MIFAVSWYFLVLEPQRHAYVHFGLELVLVFALLGAFVRLVVYTEENRTPITTAALTIFGLLYVPFLFNIVALLAFAPGSTAENRFLLVYLLAVTKFSDVGAYVIGSAFGRHKMIPRISPGKTWEGFAGAIATSLAISVTLQLVMGARMPQISLRGQRRPGPAPAAGQRGRRPGRIGGQARRVDQGLRQHHSRHRRRAGPHRQHPLHRAGALLLPRVPPRPCGREQRGQSPVARSATATDSSG